jgi:hypothetical protein
MTEEDKMDFDTLDQGLKLVEQAANILETISNEPGVSPSEFYAALDSKGILEHSEREILAQAAATVEMTLELMCETENPTIH